MQLYLLLLHPPLHCMHDTWSAPTAPMCGCQPPFFYRAQADKYQKFDLAGTCILLLEARDILRVRKKQLCEQATGGLFFSQFDQQIF